MNYLGPGDVLKERFRILRLIGSGSYGVVYLAEDLQVPGAQWAIKEIRESDIDEEERLETVERFKKEADLLRGLNHTGVPKVIDCFSRNTSHYMVMEHIEGETIEEKMKRGIPRAEDVAGWALKVCDILEYLHHLTPSYLVYRDIKPSNIMVTYRGRILLIDFGIARFYNPVKSTDTCFLGTPGFCPPEQYGARQSDRRSDIYSLGATMYQLLSGQDLIPFNFKMPPVSQFNRNVSGQLEHVICRCLEVDPDKRYQQINELRDALKHADEMPGDATQPFPALSLSPAQAAPVRKTLVQQLIHAPVFVFLWILFFITLMEFPALKTLSALSGVIFIVLIMTSALSLAESLRNREYLHMVLAMVSIFFLLFISFNVLDFNGDYNDLMTCRRNLKEMGAAVEKFYAAQGHFPDDLSQLAPAYLQRIPDCPAFGSSTYGYQHDSVHRFYMICCQGHWHETQTHAAGFPQYNSRYGVVNNPDELRKAGLADTGTLSPERADRLMRECQGNLIKIKKAITNYASAQGGRYPDSLNDLVPGSFKYLPVCPAAGTMTYRFRKSENSQGYSLWCDGNWHEDSLGRGHFPHLESAGVDQL